MEHSVWFLINRYSSQLSQIYKLEIAQKLSHL